VPFPLKGAASETAAAIYVCESVSVILDFLLSIYPTDPSPSIASANCHQHTRITRVLGPRTSIGSCPRSRRPKRLKVYDSQQDLITPSVHSERLSLMLGYSRG